MYEEGEIQGTIAELMTEQVEFSNVVIMNKQDMVSEEQQLDILDRIHLLNPKAKVLKSKQSKVDVKEILNTNLYSRSDMEENSIMISATKADSVETEKEEECCVISVEKGKKKCCKSKMKKDNTIDSGLSQVKFFKSMMYQKYSTFHLFKSHFTQCGHLFTQIPLPISGLDWSSATQFI